MHINAELDPLHAEKLAKLQAYWNKSISDAIATAIDLAVEQMETPGAKAFRIFEEEGLIGCMEGDGTLSVDYKKQLWGSDS
jgi:hypothetical protein